MGCKCIKKAEQENINVEEIIDSPKDQKEIENENEVKVVVPNNVQIKLIINLLRQLKLL